ncbi:MAG: hypothetical protein AB1899_12150 [Pseudomonadota bacterium]
MPKTWQAFARRVRGTQEKLLTRLDDYPDSVLVTGCQRSGGTMLARVLTGSEGMVNYWFGDDDELDAALVLAGTVPEPPRGRYCFQTTYLNERYREYFEHPGQRIVWSLRNPHSVVYSMVYNWKDFALNELFLACGYAEMDHVDRIRFQRFGLLGIPRIRRAAYAYNGKVKQVFELRQHYHPDRLTILEYDQLVREKTRLLPELYARIGLAYQDRYADPISERSLKKKDKLKPAESKLLDAVCMPVYEAARAILTLK